MGRSGGVNRLVLSFELPRQRMKDRGEPYSPAWSRILPNESSPGRSCPRGHCCWRAEGHNLITAVSTAVLDGPAAVSSLTADANAEEDDADDTPISFARGFCWATLEPTFS